MEFIDQLIDYPINCASLRGWSGVMKVSCILRRRVVQLILAYSWAKPAILVAGKGRKGNVIVSSVSLLLFVFLFLPCPSLSSPLLALLYLSPFLWKMMQNDPQGLTCR